MKIYIVTAGDYSDYHINGVCSTEEKADELMKLTRGDYIEEFELDKFPEHPPGLYKFQVNMNKNGDVPQRNGIYPMDCTDMFKIYAHDGIVVLPLEVDWQPSSDGYTSFYVWAKDETHAVKIANEKRVGLILNNMWFDDKNKWNEWAFLKYNKKE
jgi:hypothetical protein